MKKEDLLEWLYENLTPSCSKLPWKDENREAYRQIVAILKNQPTITKRDIENCAGAIQYSVQTHEDWGYVEDILKEMLTEAGVSICPEKSTAVDKEEK
jgi:hypothetical protein